MATSLLENPAPASRSNFNAKDRKLDNNTNQSQEIQGPSYSKVAQKVNFPKKDQAIILEAFNEIPIKEYIFAIGNIVNPRNIRFASRISNNRICLYLADSSIVHSLTKSKVNVNINGHVLPIRPLISESKRVLLSNVCPIIPHDVIVSKLTDLNINCTSAISFIKAGISDPGFSHILSFRRQVYISPEDVVNLPDSIQITHDDTTYWIYVTTDNPVCFLCKREGHIAKRCTNLNRTETLIPDIPPRVASATADNSEKLDKDCFLIPKNTEKDKLPLKRPLTDTSSNASHPTLPGEESRSTQDVLDRSSSNNILDPQKESLSPIIPINPIRPSKRKKKRQDKDTRDPLPTDKIETMLAPIKNILTQHPEAYVLSYNDVKDFLRITTGKKDIAPLASQYTTDFPALIKMLNEIYPSLLDQSIKNRITRLKKKLELHSAWFMDASNTSNDATDINASDSDCSSVHIEENIENPSLTTHPKTSTPQPSDDYHNKTI